MAKTLSFDAVDSNLLNFNVSPVPHLVAFNQLKGIARADFFRRQSKISQT